VIVVSDAASKAVHELVEANHILFGQMVLDAFGHVSARSPTRDDRFLLSRNLAPARVTDRDIVAYDLDGCATIEGAPSPYLERFLHGSIYRARPDVGAVVHSHAPAVIPFGMADSPVLRPVMHMASFLGDGAARFEIRDVAGPASDLLVVDSRLGDALAGALGESSVVLMRGHGITVVGEDLRTAVFRAVYTVVNAQVQAKALALGQPTYLTDGEARAATASNVGQMTRAWDFWREQFAGA
jgi:ribulose-5-phosphate 4-epimerase/fuculose-1-phosphate aldolase